ncbi:restriction endonuclease subunit S [Bacillus altitudinis]|uniref:restriction endonuclease subunit S n=1 Tax=Bacillus altitudinis TaxID=293387 RepID=UPI0040452A7F
MAYITKSLSEVTDMASGGTPNRKIAEYWNGDIPWVTTAEVAQNRIITNTKERITEIGLKNSSAKIFPANSILLALYGQGKTRGKVALLGIEASTNQACLAIMPNQDELEVGFLYYYLENSYEKMRSMANTGGQDNLSMAIVKEMPITYPSLDKQKKISKLFTTIDSKIQLQKEKIDLLNKRMKGYMEKIFNQELRFKDKDGQTYNNWKEYKLKDIGSTFTGLSGKSKEDFGFGNHLFITYTNVFNNLFASKNGIEKVNVLETENQALVQKGDILLTTSSETPHEVGMASIWNHSMENVHLNSFCFGYRLNQSEKILPEFVAISLRSNYMRKKIILLAQGSTRFNMSKTELMLQTIKIPFVGEQHKIVNFYKTLEQQLNLAMQQLELLKTQKQAFMQQMLI